MKLIKLLLLALTGITLNSFAQKSSKELLIAQAGFSWVNAGWAIRDTIIYTYDANNNQTSILIQFWDTSSNALVNSEKRIYTYDVNNNKTTFLFYTWNTSSNVWVNNSKYTYAYDANNNQTSALGQGWDTSSNVWVNGNKVTYTYDMNNNKTSSLTQTWNTNSNTWVNSKTKYTYIYDAKNNKTTELWQYWDTSSNAFVNNGKYIYTYDANNKQTTMLAQFWDKNSNAFVNVEKDTDTYDANNNQTAWLKQHWDKYSNVWEMGYWKHTYTYDVNNNQTTVLDQVLDFNNAWLTNKKNTYTYDANNNLTSGLTQIGNALMNTSLAKYYYKKATNGCNFTTPIITASGATTFCKGDSVTLTSSAAGAYLWSTTGTTKSITVKASGNYTITVKDTGSCSATSLATTVTVNIPPAIPTIMTGGATTFCQGDSVKLTSSSASSYLWNNGATTQSIAITKAGNYSVTIKDVNGCVTVSATTTVKVNPLPSTPIITVNCPTTFFKRVFYNTYFKQCKYLFME